MSAKPVAFLLAGLALAFSTPRAAISTLDLAAVKGPSCVIVDSTRGAQVPLAPFFTRVNVVVTDGLAQATMIQSFANPLGRKTEIAYVFPLPEKGAVHAMAYEIHDSLFRARIEERQKAQAIYDSVKSTGGNAAILLQEKPNLFQQKMANLGAGDTVHVEIQVSLPLKYADGSWELAFPTMVGERYQSAGSPAPAGTISGWNPPENREGPAFQFNVLVKDAAFDSLWSTTHPLDSRTSAEARQILSQRGLVDSTQPLDAAYGKVLTLAPQNTYPNRDFVLRLHRAVGGLDAVAGSWKPANRDTGYFHLAILPDLAADSGARPPLDLVLLVDRSGSQDGWPMDREKQIATEILRRLTPADRITLLAFDDVNEYALGSSPVPATAGAIDSAQAFVARLTARGGTLLLSAVNAALSTPLSGDMQRLFVFLTDGFITDEAAILDALGKKTPQPQVLTFGCGNSLNRYFLEEAAAVGGGFATLLTSADAMLPALDAAWSRIETPQVNGLRIDFGEMGARDVVLPTSDRLYKGLPLLADGKYLNGGRQTVTLKGQRNGTPWTLVREIDLAENSSLAWSIPKTWARAAIGRLETAEGTTSANKDSIVKLSVAFQVLSKYTAFLATSGAPVEPDASLGKAWATTQLLERAHRPVAGASRYLAVLRQGRLVVRWGQGERVDRIRILDLTGSVVRTIVPEPGAREVAWDGRSERGLRAIAGTYFLEIATRGVPVRQRITWIP